MPEKHRAEVIGRFSATAKIGRRKFSEIPTCLLWVFIHLMEIARFRNRVLMLLQ